MATKTKVSKLSFLSSVRFWQLALVGAGIGLNEYANSNDWKVAVSKALISWFGASVTVGTLDKSITTLSK